MTLYISIVNLKLGTFILHLLYFLTTVQISLTQWSERTKERGDHIGLEESKYVL